MKKLEIYDTTLRDGAQGEGISFSIEDKTGIITVLDRIGVDLIEAGSPGSTPKDTELFKRLKNLPVFHKITAFGPTRNKNNSADNDPQLKALIDSEAAIITIYGKCHTLHAEKVLRVTPDENILMIRESIEYIREHGRKVIFDAEHFFDGWKHDCEYTLKCLKAAVAAGAETIVLCDTNGGSFPKEIGKAVRELLQEIPGTKIGIHCHNDIGMAAACSLEAIQAGACQLQGSFTGFGERCGNTSLCELIPSLQYKLGYKCIPEESMERLVIAARYIADISNTDLSPLSPYVGTSAFAHKAGTHVDAMRKLVTAYEHIDPTKVGNERRFITSEMAGRSAIIDKVCKIDPELNKTSAEVNGILEELKRLEMSGWKFESAEASFDLLVRRKVGKLAPYFGLEYCRIHDDFPLSGRYGCMATVKVSVGGATSLESAEGDGPVHALDTALRKSLLPFYSGIHNMKLIDYKVRVLTPNDATAARVRVLMNSTDGKSVWTTVGVSRDIIRASWKALCDSVEYYFTQTNEKNRNNKQ